MDRINVTKTYLPPKKKLYSYINEIYKTHWITNHGPLVQSLEKRLQEYFDTKYIVLVANGTLALQIAYRALGLKGEVITTPFSFVATTSSLLWEGLTPKFVDIDPETFCINDKLIEQSITKNTTGIVPVHVFGNACNVEAIESIAKKHHLKVIYDAAHAFGVNFKNKSLLKWGDIAVLSFHATKIFHTCEGGALIVKESKIYKKIKAMIDFGIDSENRISCLGINAKMNEIEAAMGHSVLDDIELIMKARTRVVSNYLSSLKGFVKFQKTSPYLQGNCGYLPVLLESERVLLKVQKSLNQIDIYPRRYFYPSLNYLPFLKKWISCDNSDSISRRVLCLPISAELTPAVQSTIVNVIKKVIVE